MGFSRDKLKALFKSGACPTCRDFEDLINSALIMEDEGFEKTADDGLRIRPKGAGKGLLTFGQRDGDPAQWGFRFGEGSGDVLDLRRGPHHDDEESPAPLLRLVGQKDHAARAEIAANVAIGRGHLTKEPLVARSELDVRGTVRSDGRLGREVLVPADGDMHAITPTLSGCVAFEIMAGVGLKNSGRFALVHAIALNAYNPSIWDNLFCLKKRIRTQHAYYRRRGDRLKLRWAKSDEPPPDSRRPDDPNSAHGHDARYVLKIGTRNSFADIAGSEKVMIKAFVTQLWDSHTMFGDDPSLNIAFPTPRKLGEP
jgi:hypothetical protein